MIPFSIRRFIFIGLPLILISCGSKNESRSQDSDSIIKIETEEKIDIPVSVNLSHSNDPDTPDHLEYKIINETDNTIDIDCDSEYYNKYISKNRFRVDKQIIIGKSEEVEYLTLELDIVNNTENKLGIDELQIKVSKSIGDSIPQVYICTSQDTSNCINFVNQSWFDWKGFTLYYSVLKNGEAFDGTYKRSKHIPYFTGTKSIDFLADFKEMGYDFDNLVRTIKVNEGYEPRINQEYEEFSSENEKLSCLCFVTTRSDEKYSYYSKLFYPFKLVPSTFEDEYEGEATIFGKIKFDDSSHTVDFIADVSLSTSCDFGAVSYENDNFDVNLRAEGNNYILRYPYTTVIEPYGSEYVKLCISAEKSSKHEFIIDVINDNDLIIRSKIINFHHYFPKN